jgi:predicted nucleic acid-binding Zn ribbon protein
MWIAHSEDHPVPQCETCGQRLKKKEHGKGYEVV